MKNEIFQKAKEYGIDAIGVCEARVYEELKDVLSKTITPMVTDDIEKRINPFLYMSDAKSIIVCLFAYDHTAVENKNISFYAMGEDYHISSQKKMQKLSQVLNSLGYKTKCYCDSWDLCERHLAYLAGLGFFGKNHMLINPLFGSYVFIGCILTDAKIEPDKPIEASCKECDKCIKNCPGNALTEEGFDYTKCVSYITQTKQQLTEKQKSILKKSGSVWGCDACQEACRLNQNAKTVKSDFEKITHLDKSIANSGREFKQKYKARAFSWRGFNVIKRNIEIIQKEERKNTHEFA